MSTSDEPSIPEEETIPIAPTHLKITKLFCPEEFYDDFDITLSQCRMYIFQDCTFIRDFCIEKHRKQITAIIKYNPYLYNGLSKEVQSDEGIMDVLINKGHYTVDKGHMFVNNEKLFLQHQFAFPIHLNVLKMKKLFVDKLICKDPVYMSHFGENYEINNIHTLKAVWRRLYLSLPASVFDVDRTYWIRTLDLYVKIYKGTDIIENLFTIVHEDLYCQIIRCYKKYVRPMKKFPKNESIPNGFLAYLIHTSYERIKENLDTSSWMLDEITDYIHVALMCLDAYIYEHQNYIPFAQDVRIKFN